MLVTQLHQEKGNATPRLGSLIVVGKTKSGGQKSFIYHEGGGQPVSLRNRLQAAGTGTDGGDKR